MLPPLNDVGTLAQRVDRVTLEELYRVRVRVRVGVRVKVSG